MAQAQESYPLYSVRDLLELKDDPNRWIIQDMIPKQGRVLVYGKGSTFKSALVFDLCLSIASGMRFMERLPVIRTFGPVVLLSTEGSIYTNSGRLTAYMRSRNLAPDAVQLHYGQRPIQIRKPEGLETVRRIVDTIHPVLIVFDPFVSFYGGNENDSEEMAKFTEGLNEIVNPPEGSGRTGTTVLIIHHANKKDDIRGSTVLQGWFDSVLRFEVTRKVQIPGLALKRDIITVKSEKQRDGEVFEDPPLLSAVPLFDKDLGMTVFGIYDKADVDGVTAAYMKLEVLKYLRRSQAVLTRSQLSEAFKVGAEKMKTTLRWLLDDGLIEEWQTPRSTGLGREKGVTGYRASPVGSRVDAARAILRATQENGPDAN